MQHRSLRSVTLLDLRCCLNGGSSNERSRGSVVTVAWLATSNALDDLQAPGTSAPHRHRHLASRVSSRARDSRAPCSSAADPWAAPSIGSRSTARRSSHSEPRARSPTVCARRAGLAGSWALRSPIRHQLDRSGNEGHGSPPQGGVQASTSGALQRIKRPAMNHIRFIRTQELPGSALRHHHEIKARQADNLHRSP